MDGSEIWPVHLPVCFGHHCVPVRVVHLYGPHVTDVAPEQEAGDVAAAEICCSCWDIVIRLVVHL